MKTMTIRGLDKEMGQRLKAAAEAERSSVNQFVLDTLKKTLGLEKASIHTNEYRDLDFLFGVWDESDLTEFQKIQSEFNTIDEDLWK